MEPLELPDLREGVHVFLSGPMGAGKSTVARHLGALLGRPAVDLDRAIEARTGKSVVALFSERGEPGFRAIERELADELAASPVPSVIALGGGTVTDERTRAALIARGEVVTLLGDPKVLAARLEDATDRPLLAVGGPSDRDQRLAELIETRRGAYAEAHVVVDTSGDAPEAVAARVLRGLREHPVLVPLGTRSYCATFGARTSLALPKDVRRVLVVADTNTERYGRDVVSALEGEGRQAALVTLPPGEEHKDATSLGLLWDAAAREGLSRDDGFVAVGGGVVGDLTGFAAATWLRGVRFGVVPTTLLSMADSAIGGKTAIDRGAGKNLVGAFHQPSFVRIDPHTLATLPPRERRSGLAEIVKCAWLAGEKEVERLEADAAALAAGDPHATQSALTMATRVKARIVAADETETGARRALNLGHTLGHAFESASAFSLLHGEAVGLGLLAALRVAGRLGQNREDGVGRTHRLLTALGLPTDVDAWLARQDLAVHLASDKKRVGDRIRFLLPVRPGEIRVARLDVASILAAAREFGSGGAPNVG